jgi:predicted regulator of Ras-like GTPase activity (Roadblock/LC7/MglB family)
VLLLSTATGEPDVVAKVTTLDEADIKTLANMSANAVQAAQAIARFWDHPDTPFEHNMFESKSLRLYIMALSETLLLMIITPISTQLGTIRYTMRRAASKVAGSALT